MPTPRAGYQIDGIKVPSVTTVISRFKESGALLYWAFGRGRDGAASLYEDRDKAADIGTAVHAMVAAHMAAPFDIDAEELADALPDEAMRDKALMAFTAYQKWADNMRIQIISQEESMVSEKHRFGGTPDFVGVIGNELALFDIKTSAAIYTDYLIQVAAYGALWDENHPDQKLNGGFHILRFAKDTGDFGHAHYRDLSEAWEQFLLFRRAYDIDKTLRKRTG